MAAAKRKYVGENKRQKFEYQCAICKDYHQQKNTQVDHIVPVGSLNSFEDVGGFVERLFVGVDKLRLLCIPCHQIVTNEERKAKNESSLRPTDA